eukprot:CAMPEP_0182425836 /NCGR_PEP_ID=MMETSP1167-20130531/12328_1 /TAXON_ID=2988 /ORGANISM="Mallomonas Sp, Strain CCMP3275" /LENGTH=123 /DNA_ID=CAMNT_0024606865 /DNA_START=1233 /DNA_END=1604 /DNA_ORIENTATION=-
MDEELDVEMNEYEITAEKIPDEELQESALDRVDSYKEVGQVIGTDTSQPMKLNDKRKIKKHTVQSYNALRNILITLEKPNNPDTNWKPQYTGLKQCIHDDGTVAWVSSEGEKSFKMKGVDALM